MGTLRLGAFAAFLLAIVPVSAQAAQTAPEDGMGCPQGFIAFDAQSGQGGPPSYEPGSEAVASGYLTDATTKAAPSVTLRWGAPDGLALGDAALDAHGNFKGLRFTVPADVARGGHTLYLEAHGADGRMLPGLPIPVQVRVGAPPAPAPVDAATKEQRDVPAARAERRTAAPHRTVAPRRSAAPTASRRTVAPPAPARVVTGELSAPALPAERPAAAPAVADVPAPSLDRPAAPLRTGGPAPRPLAGPAADRDRTTTTATAALRDDGLVEPADPWLLALLLGSLGLVLGRARRRRGPSVPPATGIPSARDLRIEAELQELINEQRAARREADEKVPV